MTFRAVAVMVVINRGGGLRRAARCGRGVSSTAWPTRSSSVARSLSYFGIFPASDEAPARRPDNALALTLLRATAALRSRLRTAREEEEFDPVDRVRAQHEWVPIHVGPLDMSITKAVAYLILASIVHDRARAPAHAREDLPRSTPIAAYQTSGEMLYDIAQTQIAEQGLPLEGDRPLVPHVASPLLFIFVVNIHRLHPASALERDVRHLRRRAADAGHLRGHVFDLRSRSLSR